MNVNRLINHICQGGKTREDIIQLFESRELHPYAPNNIRQLNRQELEDHLCQLLHIPIRFEWSKQQERENRLLKRCKGYIEPITYTKYREFKEGQPIIRLPPGYCYQENSAQNLRNNPFTRQPFTEWELELINSMPQTSLRLIIASKNGNLEDVERLLNFGVDVNAEEGLALRLASQNGHLEIVNKLLESGADVNIKNSESLENASIHGHLDIVERLLEAGANTNAQALINASQYGHLEIVEKLIEAGADPTATIRNNSPLKMASKMGHPEIVKKLLETGEHSIINLDKALTDARRLCHREVVKLIEAKKQDYRRRLHRRKTRS